MFKRKGLVTLPTDYVILELLAATNNFCRQHNLPESIGIKEAANLVNAYISDIVNCDSKFIKDIDSAETLLRTYLPWYQHSPQLAADYFPNVFDAVLLSTEQLVNDLIESMPYDLWDIRTTNHLTTIITYLGDYRILEWEKQNRPHDRQLNDVSVNGDDSPRLMAGLLAVGHYRSMRTGKVIYRVSDIDGEIIDVYGNVVITTEDITKGFV